MTDLATQSTADTEAAKRAAAAAAKAKPGSAGYAHDVEVETVDTANAGLLTAQNTAANAASTAGTQTPTAQSTAPSATSIINNVVNSIPGLSLADPSGVFAAWINSQVNAMNQTNTSASDMIASLTATINNPAASGDAQAQAVFDQLFPGYNQRIAATGNNGGGLGAYLSYSTQLQAMAETAGMPPGTLSTQEIGNAWGNDASTTEMSQRITTEYTNAVNALPAVQNELKNYGYVQDITPGQLAAYYINPTNTVNQLQQQFNAATVGGEGVLTGFGEMGQSQAYALQAFLSNNGQNDVSNQQAAAAFGSTIGPGGLSAAAAAKAGFENASTGTSTSAANPGVVGQGELVSAIEGNAGALSDVRRAAETRSAGSSGGGGFAAGNTGVSGAGYGQQ